MTTMPKANVMKQAKKPGNGNGKAEAKPAAKVLWPTMEIIEYWPGGKRWPGGKLSEGPITWAMMKKILGWETHEEYVTRRKAETAKAGLPEPSEKELRFNRNKQFVIEDEYGNEVICHNNNHNRPFSREHALDLAHRMLNRRWAGPTCFPGETVNGEPIIVTRTGEVDNGQHTGVGFMLGCQLTEIQSMHWKELWPDGLTLDKLVICGISDDPRITRTIDDVRARTEADVFATGEHFRDLSNEDRKNCGRMLAKAVDFLWRRTRQVEINQWAKYRDHAESEEFVSRHPRLRHAVRIIFRDNKEHILQDMDLSPGQCAAMLYLMGSSQCQDADNYYFDYKNADQPSERKLNWDLWETAVAFWKDLIKGAQDTGSANARFIVQMLQFPSGIPTDTEDEEHQAEVHALERSVVLAKAWNALVANPKRKLAEADLKLNYETSETGKVFLQDDSLDGFGGIDQGPKVPKKKEAATAAEDEDGDATPKTPKQKKESAEALNERLKAQKKKESEGVSATVAEPGTGKPPVPKIKKEASVKNVPLSQQKKRVTAKDVVAEQTRQALEADKALAASGNSQAAAAVAAHTKKNGGK